MGERKKLDLHTTQILADIKLGSFSEIKSIKTGAPLVPFYETDAALIKAWSNCLAGAGDKGISTKKHLQQLERNLKARGLLPDSGRHTKEHCFPLAADRMLSLFIADDLPNNAPCKHAIGDVINPIVVCHDEHDAFLKEKNAASFDAMCNLHSVVLQTERFASIAKIDSLQRTIVTLQQQACSLASQVHERTRIKEAPASLAAVSRKNAQLHADLQQENSARKRAEETLLENEAYIRHLMEATIIGVTFWHVDGGISYANDTFLQLSGYSTQDLLSGKILWTDMTPLEYRASEDMAMEELIKTGTCKPVEKEYIRKDGSRVPVLVGLAMLKGSRERGVSFVLDLTARKQAEEQVRRMANHDALTSLPNRMLLQDRMRQAIAFAHRNHSRVAIMFVDLDYFKNINDSLGHHVGDEVLKMTAMHLQKSLREGDSVSRLGGDEFVLILPLLYNSNDAAWVAQKALNALAQPCIVDGHDLHISASIGISLYPDDGADVETLMRSADAAMYHAKKMKRGNFQFFTEALNQEAKQRLDVRSRLRHALAHNEFVLHYQPQVDMQSGAIFSTEALLRWQAPGAQPISCGAFIANAEESGLIVPIGEWTLRQACKQLKIWRDAGHSELKMAVNLSPRQLEDGNFCMLIEHILDQAGIPAAALELEITESILMQHSELNLATLTRLSHMGIQLSVDDFGTGYSSLSYLQRFPVHAIKIDQSFVREIGKDPNDTALITAIIAMANSLHRKVIAEGVETLQQAQFLLAHGCLAAQGFYYSQAVPAETLLELLKSHYQRTN